MQVAGPGPNLGWIRKNTIEDLIELFHMILLSDDSLKKFTTWLAATRSSEACFLQKIHMKDHMQDHMKGRMLVWMECQITIWIKTMIL